ncbi:MAG: PRC-barrel domain-containing protein [Aestuariivirga sp.]
MNKHVLALSTALSILAFTPAFAQESTSPAPAVDCTQPANANDPACANQQNQSGTTTTTTDQNAQSGTTTTTDPNAQSGSTTTTTTDQSTTTGQTGTSGTDTGTGSTVTTTTTDSSTQQMSAGELIVPADQLNSAQVMSANDYIGKTVYDQAGNNIGEVNDLIVSGDGNIEAVILGVGGFLGIGEKDVAVNTAAIQMVQDGDNQRLVVQATKEALESAPTYDRSNRRYAEQPAGGMTTDQTGSTTTAPAEGTGTTGATVDCSLPENANNAACVNQQQNQQQ